MANIKVIAKVGNTYHPRFGLLEFGREYEIDEAEFGDEIFEKQQSAKSIEHGAKGTESKNTKRHALSPLPDQAKKEE